MVGTGEAFCGDIRDTTILGNVVTKPLGLGDH